MSRDPIVEEIRNVRQLHAAQFDNDLRLIYEDLVAKQKSSGRKVIKRPPRQHLKKTGS